MDGNNEIEIPQFFICPISLQIMTDPVTTVTGITYDRQSIDKWLTTATTTDSVIACPVTKQPLPRDSDLTPNHMLRRLIQAWCIANAQHGVDRIPTPKSPPTRAHLLKLIRDLRVPHLCMSALVKMDGWARENEKNRCIMAEAGVSEALTSFILTQCHSGTAHGLEEALRALHLTWSSSASSSSDGTKHQPVRPDHNTGDLLQSILWILKSSGDDAIVTKAHAVIVLRRVVEAASSDALERLKMDFFKEMVNVVRHNKVISPQAVKSALHVLIQVCPIGRNRMKMIEAGAVLELVELEWSQPEKKSTELIFILLGHLCSVADGRAQLLSHAGGIAVVAERTLRVSSATDDRAVHILGLLARYSGTKQVVAEMMRVGAVAKLCMVLQADCEGYLKKEAREILRLHSHVWNKSPCIQVYLLARYP